MENCLVFLCHFWLLFQAGIPASSFQCKYWAMFTWRQIPNKNQKLACTAHSNSLFMWWKDLYLLGFMCLIQAGYQIRDQKHWRCCFWTLLRQLWAVLSSLLALLHNLAAHKCKSSIRNKKWIHSKTHELGLPVPVAQIGNAPTLKRLDSGCAFSVWPKKIKENPI